MNAKKMILQTMLTTQLPIPVVLTFPLSFLNKSPEVVSIDGIQITSSTEETLSGIAIDSELNFENHLSAICIKVSRKINTLGRITNYMPIEKHRIVMIRSV